MKTHTKEWRRFLTVATSPSITQWPAIFGVVLLSVLIHLLASIDVGFEQVFSRIVLATISVLPMFAIIKTIQLLQIQKRATLFVLIAIILGGLIRGEIIEYGLEVLEVQSKAISDYRALAGVVIALTITLIMGYSWSTVQETRTALTNLRAENQQLQSAFNQIDVDSRVQETNRALDLLKNIRDQVQRISSVPVSNQVKQLEQLISDVVRPISKSWAKELDEYEPVPTRSPEVTLRGVWNSLDPVKHLPSPLLSTFVIIFSAMAAAIGTFGRTIAFQLAIILAFTLYSTLSVGYYFARKFLSGKRSWTMDILLTIFLVVITSPSVIATVLILRDTQNPYAFVLPGFITVPLMGWIFIVGNAAFYQSAIILEELKESKHKLSWSIARINLLSWYQQGIISRLLHGAIQNSIQVGLTRIQSARSEVEQREVLKEVISRIDDAIREVSDETQFSRTESEALANIVTTWTGVASIHVSLSETSEAQLQLDPASFSITVDLIQELCSNAIRHGGATTINFEIDIKKDTLAIQGTDNGNSFSGTSHRSGLGTHFIESCTTRYDRQRIDGRNIYALEIPFIA